jgi:hypothetical protein
VIVLNSVVFERDNLQMELSEALSQIDRLEQMNKYHANQSLRTQETYEIENIKNESHLIQETYQEKIMQKETPQSLV